MAWNEPGKDQDPWGGGNKKSDGPPDLDQIWQRLRSRLSKSGKSGGNGNGGNGSSGGIPGPSPKLLLLIIPVIAVIWLLTGFFVIQPGGQGVVLRFGNYTQTVTPGWHWYWPSPVGDVISVDTQRVRSASTRGIVLTKDESLAELQVSLQYRVDKPMNYLFQLTNPDRTVEQVLKSAVREVVGTSRLNQVIQEGVSPDALSDETLQNVDLKKGSDELPTGNPLANLPDDVLKAVREQQKSYPEINARSRALLPQNVSSIVQTTLNHYQAGVHIIAVNVSYAQPPEAVQSAFEEAIKAREAKERKKNIARAYAREILARVKGQKASILAQAKAYKAKKVADANGDTSRFSQLAKQYAQAPQITHQRLYLETMGEVLGAARLVLTEDGKGGPLMYLPLPGMQGQAAAGTAKTTSGQDDSNASGSTDASNPPAPSATDADGNTSSSNLRSRGRNP